MKQVGIDAIRNMAFLGHGGSGKSSMAEALLFSAANIDRLGRVDDGSSCSDFDDDEKKRHISINLSVIPVLWKETKLNILDAPGFLDFVGEVYSALAVSDAAVIFTPATSALEVGFHIAWEQVEDRSLPCAVCVNKMDRENADFGARVRELRGTYGTKVVPVAVPIGSQTTFDGVIDLLNNRAIQGVGAAAKEVPVDSVIGAVQDDLDEYRQWLTEAAAEGDDELMMKYLEEEQLTPEEVAQGIVAAFKAGKIVPVFGASAANPSGLTAVLDLMAQLFPTPADRGPARSATGDETRLPSDSEPFSAFVFKTTADPFVGKLTYFKVMSGQLKADSHVWNANKSHDERIGQPFFLRGKTQANTAVVGAGDIAAVSKLQETGTNDTLCDRAKPIVYPPIAFPKPVYSLAVRAKSKADEDKMGNAIARMAEEDPTFTYHRDPETSQTVISGMGDTHLDVAMARMKRKFGTEVETEPIRIAYREAIQGKAEAQGRHKKQTGGRGQFGDCWIRIEPTERGAGFEFADEIFGGAIPKQYVPAVEKGVRTAMARGVIAGYPVVDVKVTVYDGSFHTVDSSDAAFQMAGILAFNNAAAKAGVALLEPIMKVEVIVPEEDMGAVMSDFNGKRGRVLGMESAGKGRQLVTALVPQAEMLRYAIDLRSITRGRGSFTTEFSHYEEVPAHVAQPVIDAYKAQKAKDE